MSSSFLVTSRSRHLIPSYQSPDTSPSSLLSNFWGYPFPVSSSRAQPRDLSRETLIKSLSDFTLEILYKTRNNLTRIASYLRKAMTKSCIKFLVESDSAISSAFPQHWVSIAQALAGKRRLGATYFCFHTCIVYRSARKISRFARNDDTRVPQSLILSHSSLLSNFWGYPFPVSSSRAQPRDLSCTAVSITQAQAGKRRLGATYFCFHTCIVYRFARKISRFARNDDTGV